ncbi:MAG: hypothetical protein EPN57_26680 [Paraburkholderia sp.]|nr:MAG: hypothetical protein EPN57_26680 [Paraburkholderia sp.]
MQRNQRRDSQRNAVSQCGRAEAGKDLLDLARDCGMTVTLDACIGRERYESVTGSCDALRRFAHAYRQLVARRPDRQLERGLLEHWAKACEQGRGDQVANAIRTWLDGDETDGADARYDD